jgi:uncharacterized repeat protein (TIGR03803 family)
MLRLQHGLGRALVGAALAFSLALPLGAAAATAHPSDVIYNFTGGKAGEAPYGSLIRDRQGNFYGTTSLGGSSNCLNGGCGVVFKLSPLGVETVLYRFTGGSDGANPFGALIRDGSKNLYGTTNYGGVSGCGAVSKGCGVVFKLTPGGVETVLHAFTGGNDGEAPFSGPLVRDTAGNFYGTTGGGATNLGTAFKLTPGGTETVLHAFTGGLNGGGADGSHPYGGVIIDENGNLYGIAYQSSGGQGNVFKIGSDGKFSVLHDFTGGADGGNPWGGLVRDNLGNLYGTTLFGGADLRINAGVVFKLAPDGTETVLHNFTPPPYGSDGKYTHTNLIMDQQGNLYGVTFDGGDRRGHGDPNGGGVVFQISPDGTETILRRFKGFRSNPPDGSLPYSSLIKYMNKVYGTTVMGGTGAGCYYPGCGVVFEVRKAK